MEFYSPVDGNKGTWLNGLTPAEAAPPAAAAAAAAAGVAVVVAVSADPLFR